MNSFNKSNYYLTIIALMLFTSMNAQQYFGLYGPPNSGLTFNTGNDQSVPILWFSDNTDQVSPVTSDGPIGVSAVITNTASLSEAANPPASDPHFEAMFGAQSNNTGKALRSKPLIVAMDDVGTPINNYYSPIEGLSGMDVTSHFAFEQYVSTEGLLNEALAGTSGLETDARIFMGRITYTFTEPVINPIYHVTGLGGFFSSTYSTGNPDFPPVLLFATELVFVPSSSAATIEQLSGTVNTELVDENGEQIIRNTYPYENYAAGLGNEGVEGDEAGSGSFKVIGSGVTEISFDMYMVGKNPDQKWSTVPDDPNPKYTGDRFNTTWTLTTESILPVELLNFNARRSGEVSMLSWESAVELDFSHYEIERSEDAENFEKIGQVLSTGSNSSYEFIDRAPFEGVNYYRLKMFDIDGTYEYSVIRSVNFESKDRGIVLYPNPTSDKLYIEKVPNGAKVSIFTIDGKQVDQIIVGNAIRQEFSLKSNTPGVYLVEVSNKGVTNHYKVVLTK